jgi:endonuclease/exonuclease/phosphatase family metal-dependent hydrolase
MAGAGLRRIRPKTDVGGPESLRGRLLIVGGALVLVGTAITGGAWVRNQQSGVAAAGRQVPGTSQVLTWNLHYGVSPPGSVDLEATARTIEQHNPDAVLLQEVSRGWVLGGGVDMATWLSNRLDRQFVFAPAADHRFGNVIMARAEPMNVHVQSLPYGDGPQNRSAVSAQVRLGQRLVRVESVHLQNRQANAATRLLEVSSLLADLTGVGEPGTATIVAGDFNAPPGSHEIALMTGAGFVSAIDTAGDAKAVTSPNPDPTRRIDWVFGRGLTFTDARVLTDAGTSDHLPVDVTATR